MEKKSKFIAPEKQGYSIRNGMLYEFKKNSVNVSRPWPPCKYTKTKKSPFWHYSPTYKITLHHTALQYSVEIEKGLMAVGSSKVPECENQEIVKNADESRKLIEDNFWTRYALPAGGIQDDIHWQESLAKQRKWTPVIASFYDKIPLKVREMMLGNSEAAWNICAFYARCPGADELMTNFPAIGFMLSNFPVFRPKLTKKWDAVRRIMRKPRRKILSWLGWPDSEAAAKILSKIQYPACDKTRLLMLRTLLKRNPELIKPISHLKTINSASFQIICRNSYRKQASWRFMNELGLMKIDCDENMTPEIQNMFIHTLSMEKALLRAHGPIQSIANLRKRHQHAIDAVNMREISELEKNKDFPAPPVPVPLPTDDFEIYPLDSPLKLYKEAKEQHNCAFTCYTDRILESGGNVYIYSMKKPERATVAVEFDYESGCFLPGEIKGPLNKQVSGDTLSKIIGWLDKLNL